MKKMTPTIQIGIGFLVIAVGAILSTYGGYQVFKGFERNNEIIEEDSIRISFQKLAIYHVEIDKDFYQMGVVLRFLNLDDETHLIKGVYYDNLDYQINPRKTFYLKSIIRYPTKGELIENNYLKPNGISEIKILLPMKLNIVLKYLTPPEVIFFGDWSIELQDIKIGIKPDFYGNYDKAISIKEWDKLLKPNSKIDPENIEYKRSPKKISKTGPDYYYLMFNPDRSSMIDIYGFHNTNYVKNENGVMVFLMGKGEPPTDNGWVVLGNTYSEVWKNSERLKVYNSIYPPDQNGHPRPFGIFAGHNDKMMGE